MNTITVSRANVVGHAFVVAAHVAVGEHCALVFLSAEEWCQVHQGAAVDVVPNTIALGLIPGMGE